MAGMPDGTKSFKNPTPWRAKPTSVTSINTVAAKRESDNQMAGDGKAIGQHAEHIAEKNEHEQREDEREIPHALSADIFLNHISDEFIGHLAH